MIAALSTARLLLRPLQACDEALYCRLYGDPDLMRHIAPALPEARARRAFALDLDAAAASAPRRAVWAMIERHGADAIGLLALMRDAEVRQHAEIGALLQADRHNRGYAAEAIAALVAHAFGMRDVDLLYTRHTVVNGAAGGLMKKLGFDVRQRGDSLRWERRREACSG